MKKLFTLILLLEALTAFAQGNVEVVNGYTVTLTPDNNLLSTNGYYKRMNTLFSQVAVGQTGADLSNYATFEPINGAFKFNGFAPIFASNDEEKRIHFLSVNLAGELLGNNIGVLFDNSRLNTNVAAQFKFHLAINRGGYSFFSSERSRVRNLKESMRQKAFADLRKLDRDLTNLTRTTTTLQRKRTAIQGMVSAEEAVIVAREVDLVTLGTTNPNQSRQLTDSIFRTRERIDTWYDEIFDVDQKIAALNATFNRLLDPSINPTDRNNNTQKETKSIVDVYKAKKLELEMGAKLNTVSLMWFNINFGFSKKKYYTFFDTLAFGRQVNKQELEAFDLGGAWNYYYQNMLRHVSIYLNVGINRIKGNNMETLSATDITDERKIKEGEIERKIITKYNAFTEPIDIFHSWQLFTNVYFLFGEKNASGFHIFPEVILKDKANDQINIALGYVMSFKDRKDKKSIFNVETFFKFIDLGDELNMGNTFLRRNEIGVSFGIPFNYISSLAKQ